MHRSPLECDRSESDRLAALERYGILDTPPEQAFDEIVQLVSELLVAPIAAVNLIAEGRQWFKAEIGLGVREMALDASICAVAILHPGGLVVPDTTQDPRFNCNPLVTGAPGLRFYAGELLETPDGYPLGTLCVLDTKPRPEGLSTQQRLVLKTLAHQVVAQLELRRAVAEQDKTIAQYRRIETELRAERDRSHQLLENEKQHATVLGKVATAARTINAVLSVNSIAQVVVEESRQLLGVHQAVISLTDNQDWSQAITAFSLSDKYAKYRSYSEKTEGSGIYAEVCRTNQSMRLTQQELEHHPAWKGFGRHAPHHPPMRGWLAVPLIGHGGKNLGLIQASDKCEGEFNEQDEAILTQIAAIAAVGIENARLYDSLREQDRRKDEFLATLAHELRNPLAPIRTGLEVLNFVDDASRASQVRAMMERQLTHLVRLVDDLMDVARVSQGKVELKRERLSLRSIVEAAVESSRPLIEAAQHTLSVSPVDASLFVHGDLTRLAQSLGNIVTNAIKYSPPGSVIELSVLPEQKDVLIRVKDNGIGIAREMLPKIFDLFTQVGHSIDRSQGGLGIGLSLVRKLVEVHGGSVVAESEGLGKGSTFTIRLPLVQDSSAASISPDEGRRKLDSTVKGKRIMVVDDNVDAAQALGILLEYAGHHVTTVHDGLDALRAVKDVMPEVVFLDIGLPRMSGYDVAAALRKDPALNGILLIATTGWGSEEDLRLSKEAGFDQHLIKPVDIRVVLKVLEQFFSRAPAA
ncbi:ATP-binding protein [Klebsiella pneumoniae]